MKIYMVAAVLLIAVLPAFADTVFFQTYALQPGKGFFDVPLGPGLDPLLNSYPGDSLSFATGFGPIGPFVSVFAINLPGLQSTRGPYMSHCDDPGGCFIIYGWGAEIPRYYVPTPGSLTATVNGVSETYFLEFQYQPPVLEPGTLVLFGSGLIGVTNFARRRFGA